MCAQPSSQSSPGVNGNSEGGLGAAFWGEQPNKDACVHHIHVVVEEPVFHNISFYYHCSFKQHLTGELLTSSGRQLSAHLSAPVVYVNNARMTAVRNGD